MRKRDNYYKNCLAISIFNLSSPNHLPFLTSTSCTLLVTHWRPFQIKDFVFCIWNPYLFIYFLFLRSNLFLEVLLVKVWCYLTRFSSPKLLGWMIVFRKLFYFNYGIFSPFLFKILHLFHHLKNLKTFLFKNFCSLLLLRQYYVVVPLKALYKSLLLLLILLLNLHKCSYF